MPALDALREYSARIFAHDVSAGLTVAAVAVPQAMAYAQIAGIPPQYGLYTAIVMTAVGALLDSSKQLINGPTNAISIACLSALVGFSDAERIPAEWRTTGIAPAVHPHLGQPSAPGHPELGRLGVGGGGHGSEHLLCQNTGPATTG